MTETSHNLSDLIAQETAAGRMSFQLGYGDCDVVDIAYFAIYYPWMELAYSAWLYAHGIRSGETQDHLGIVTVGFSSGATYVNPAHVFDRLTCSLVLDRLGTTSYIIGFDFHRGDELITRGHMAFATRGLNWAKTPVPESLSEILRTLPRRTTDESNLSAP